MTNIYDFSAEYIDGGDVSLKKYEGKALLIVNTASKCGFTPQYAGLEKLHRDLAADGFEVLGFPCNQFGAQEPGDAEEIKNFCVLKYDVSFPVFAKVDVNGAKAHPLFVYLTKQLPGLLGSQAIKWNFTKFLIDRKGAPVSRHAPRETPESLRKNIEKLLG
ncbi:MAG: glutathione peroxidase [Rhodoblastus sp.]